MGWVVWGQCGGAVFLCVGVCRVCLVSVWVCIEVRFPVLCWYVVHVVYVGVRVVLYAYCLWWASVTVECSGCEGWVLQFVTCIFVGVEVCLYVMSCVVR